jgi:hypothetical protein
MVYPEPAAMVTLEFGQSTKSATSELATAVVTLALAVVPMEEPMEPKVLCVLSTPVQACMIAESGAKAPPVTTRLLPEWALAATHR